MNTPPSLSSLTDHLGFWLRLVSNRVSHHFASSLKHQHDLSVAEWVMLRQLFDLDVCSIGTLGQITGMTKGAVSKVIDRLSSKNLIRLEDDTQDRRIQLVRLSPIGIDLLPALTQLADQNDEHFFGALSVDEQNQLKRILQQLADIHHITSIPLQ